MHSPVITYRKKARRLLAGTFLVVVVGVIGSVLLVTLIGIVGVSARTKGTIAGYHDGVVEGRAQACRDLNHQMQWVFNTENDLVKAGKESAAVGAKLKAEALAAYHYTCERLAAVAPNLYDPSAKAPVVPAGPVTFPTGHHASVAQTLLHGKPSPKPTPSPSPSD